jgi:hypothetical protein|tara:strand:- start:9218 stop:9664 length:447 start_codon:yes stop_codon:yes gene_type:complete
LDSQRERYFPNLIRGQYQDTSSEDPFYNCIAWSVGDESRWWQPSGRAEHYWPPGFPIDDYSVNTLVAVFQQFGFELCETADLDQGYEKIAVYASPDRDYAHTARQLVDGRWASKMGEWEDIEHDTVDVLEGQTYGTAQTFLHRPTDGE